MSLDYRELSDLLFVVIRGTAVKLAPVPGAGSDIIDAIENLV